MKKRIITGLNILVVGILLIHFFTNQCIKILDAAGGWFVLTLFICLITFLYGLLLSFTFFAYFDTGLIEKDHVIKGLECLEQNWSLRDGRSRSFWQGYQRALKDVKEEVDMIKW